VPRQQVAEQRARAEQIGQRDQQAGADHVGRPTDQRDRQQTDEDPDREGDPHQDLLVLAVRAPGEADAQAAQQRAAAPPRGAGLVVAARRPRA
jgi:hypothetical protein